VIPLMIFLLACVTIYIGTIAAAFAALMRLPLRLDAERHDWLDRLGYLENPVRLFVPLRFLEGVLIILVAAVNCGRGVSGIDDKWPRLDELMVGPSQCLKFSITSSEPKASPFDPVALLRKLKVPAFRSSEERSSFLPNRIERTVIANSQ